MLYEGFNNRQIASALNLSEGTSRNYISTIYMKLGCDNRNDAIRVENGSLQRGLLSISCSDSSDTANLIPRMQFSWKFAEMPEALVESYDPSLQQAVALYRQSVNVRFAPLFLPRTAPSSSPSAPSPCCASSSSSRASASSSSPATSWGFHVSTTHRASAIWRAWRVRATRTSTCTARCRCRPTSTRWISSCSRRREQCSTRPIWRASLCAKRGRVTRRTRCT